MYLKGWTPLKYGRLWLLGALAFDHIERFWHRSPVGQSFLVKLPPSMNNQTRGTSERFENARMSGSHYQTRFLMPLFSLTSLSTAHHKCSVKSSASRSERVQCEKTERRLP